MSSSITRTLPSNQTTGYNSGGFLRSGFGGFTGGGRHHVLIDLKKGGVMLLLEAGFGKFYFSRIFFSGSHTIIF